MLLFRQNRYNELVNAGCQRDNVARTGFKAKEELCILAGVPTWQVVFNQQGTTASRRGGSSGGDGHGYILGGGGYAGLRACLAIFHLFAVLLILQSRLITVLRQL